MKRVSQKVPERIEQIFNRRSLSIYSGMKERAFKKGLTSFPFILADFRIWLLCRFVGEARGIVRCEYSGEILSAENFSVDHRDPISRGGTFELNNLAICSEKENLRKGNMRRLEYREFQLHVSHYPPEVQAAIWRKLEVGDVQRFGYFRRKSKCNK